MKNANLRVAKRAKKDEFYTCLEDIEAELQHYEDHFVGRTVYLNYDDYRRSKFWIYFIENAERLGIKRVIATHYSEWKCPLFDKRMPTYHAEWNSGTITVHPIDGNGDFRSQYCIELLKHADIVVTNPPFSLFHEYVAQLIEYNKKFLIIGNQNAITYKEIFPFIKANRIWLGVHVLQKFTIPSHYPLTSKSYRIEEDGGRVIKANGVKWFTNLPHNKCNEKLILYHKYSPEKYPHYDNYDAIEVSKVKDIPEDWTGAMGVPITFMDKYNPDQFEILGIPDRSNSSGLRIKKYTRSDCINYHDLNVASIIKEDGVLKSTYSRILIRHKQP